MGKTKRAARHHSNHHDAPKSTKSTKSNVVRRQHSQQNKILRLKKFGGQSQSNGQPQARPKIPFTRHDNVLLVGEGDFSFSLALKKHHRPARMLASCFDSREVLEGKYPEVQGTVTQLEEAERDNIGEDEPEWKGLSPSPSPPGSSEDVQAPNSTSDPNCAVRYNIDATKLSSAHRKAFKPFIPFTKIVFNFPHVGGISTDVNRQVRYNQELLVGFFKAAKPLLSSLSRAAKLPQSLSYASDDDGEELDELVVRDRGAVNGQILVTLFEGEPYTLWNVRDLARHSGLKVVESFKFPWSAYPGYQHARTVGDITSGKDRSEEGKRRGAWRGEERDARCYVLEDKDAEPTSSSTKKRKRSEKDDDSD
jgi:25S rRNA (uracil2634-N3)-methyltransferase